MRTSSSTGFFYEFSGHGVLRGLWEGWESKLRLYLSVDHRSYGDLNDIAVEHERLAAVALEGDTDAFRQELARHFESALRGQTEAPGQLELGPAERAADRFPARIRTSEPLVRSGAWPISAHDGIWHGRNRPPRAQSGSVLPNTESTPLSLRHQRVVLPILTVVTSFER